jgi:NADH:ubiquinone oxidoreductase subunit C
LTDFEIFINLSIVKLFKSLPKLIRKISTIQQNILAILIRRDAVCILSNYIRFSSFLRLEQLVDIAVVDHFTVYNKRFRVNYIFLSHFYKTRFIINVAVNSTNEISSLTNIFNGSTWLEREAYDMFGIIFNGNIDLRRILSDYGFSGHPLKKDFPLTGFKEHFYSDLRRRIVPMSVQLTQEYRTFS